MSSNRGMTDCRCCGIQILDTAMSQLCGRCFWALSNTSSGDMRCSYHDTIVTTARDDNVIKR